MNLCDGNLTNLIPSDKLHTSKRRVGKPLVYHGSVFDFQLMKIAIFVNLNTRFGSGGNSSLTFTSGTFSVIRYLRLTFFKDVFQLSTISSSGISRASGSNIDICLVLV